jgi:hypothetical protein
MGCVMGNDVRSVKSPLQEKDIHDAEHHERHYHDYDRHASSVR